MNALAGSGTDSLGRLRRAALFAVALATAIAATIPLFRLGFDLDLPAIGLAWSMLTLALLLPILLLERLPDLPNRDLLAGPLTIATLLAALAISFLGIVGLAVIVLAALVALADALRRCLRVADWRRFWPWLVVGVICFVPLLGALMGVKYANFIADQLALYGRADGDTLFHGAIINGFRYFGVPATGVDGVRPFGYHVGVHFLASRIAVLTGAEAIPVLIAVRAVLLTPLLVYALVHGGLILAARRSDKPSVIAAVVLAILLLLALPSLGLGVGDIKSESFMLATALFLLAFAPLYLRATDASIKSPIAGIAIWVFALAAIFVLAASKVSVGYVFAGIVGYWALREYGLKNLRFWLIAAAIAVIGLGSLWLFSPSAGESGAVLFGTPFYVEYGFQSGNPLLPVTVNVEGLALIGLLLYRHRKSGLGFIAALQQDRLLGLETFVVILLIANLPGLLMQIGGGDATYFIQIFDWAAKPLIIAELLLLRPWAPRAAATVLGRWIGPALAGLAVIGCVIGLFRAAQTQTNISVAMMALVRSGDLTYFDSTKRKELRSDANRAMNELGWSGLFTAPPPEAPAANLATALHALRSATGNDGTLYVPPEADTFWNLTADCDGKSLLPMALAGVPLLNGYSPDQAECPQEFALSGYAGVPARISALDASTVCVKAKENRATQVMTLRSLAETDSVVTTCPGE